LLSVRGVSVDFNTDNGVFRAVDGLDFDVRPGRTLAIVGESGSGKSVTSMAIMRLTDYTSGRIATGQILFRDNDGRETDLTKATDEQMRAIRGNDIAMIFQEPMTSLNPVFTIGDQIVEAIMLHQQLSRSAARQSARKLLEKVRLPDAEQLLDRYPHQLSGGMRQRVMIAMALSCQPRLLIADEPTTALDVTIQAQILNTIRELQRDLGTAVIFITHDMGVVAEMADDVVVMLRGKKVEQGTVDEIFNAPKHPYTRALLAAVPRLGSLTGSDLPLRTPQTVLDGDTLREVGETRQQDTARYDEPVLRVEKLTTRFDVGHNLFGRVTHRVHAVEEVSFDVYPGETLALVGESGSGKSTIGKTLQQLVAPTSGAVRYNGQDIFSMDAAGRQRLHQGQQIDVAAATGQAQQFVAGFGVARITAQGGHHEGRAGPEERCIQRQAQAAVDQHTQRRAAQGQRGGLFIQPQLGTAHGHPCVVGQHTGGAGQHHTGARTQALHGGARGWAGDPLAFAAGHGGAAVQAHGQLGADEWQAVFHAFQEPGVEGAGLGFEYATGDFDAGIRQALQALAGDLRVRVLHGCHHTRHARLHQCLGARRRAAMVAARFKGNVGAGAAGTLTGLAQGMHLGMRLAGAHMPALTDHLAIADDHATHTRVGVGGVRPLAGKLQGTGHVMGVENRGLARHAHSLAGSRARRSISSRNSSRSWKRRYTEAKRI